ncbi:MAG TPA: HAD family hydrolase [Candidatus Limnocylindrales bacterium]|nr:HAD family hydrolase [Candidatus Limnocylindrales bacterium]
MRQATRTPVSRGAVHTDRPAVLFDLDGTLIDSVYQHVLAWKEALEGAGIQLSVWRIHRRIGMSGGLFLRALVRETGRELSATKADHLRALHEEGYRRRISEVRPLPGAQELLDTLTRLGVPWAIATSSSESTAQTSLTLLRIPSDVPVVTRDRVEFAKPNPDLFLAAADALGRPIAESFVVGDSVWDMLAAQRAHALGVGLLSGGYGREELETSGAYRVYDDPQDLLQHIDELGIRMRG